MIVASHDARIIDNPRGQVAVGSVGYDTCDPVTRYTTADRPDMGRWMLMTGHDGESFLARSIHFPGADEDVQIKNLLSCLGCRADEVEAAAPTAVRSAPFDPPNRERVAVRVVTRAGMEITGVAELTSDRRGWG